MDKESLISGEIDTISDDRTTKRNFSQKVMALKLSNVQLREWFQRQRELIVPWSDFFNSKKFKVPKGVAPMGPRILKNVTKFQSNYLFICLGLLAFCVLTTPLLLVALAISSAACYYVSVKNADRKFSLMGHEVTIIHQYVIVGLLSFPLFYLAGAGSAVFWVLGASLFVILLHSLMYNIEDNPTAEPFELTMETV